MGVRRIVWVTGYLLFILALCAFTDAAYARFWERLPPLRGRVAVNTGIASCHRPSEIDGLFYDLKPRVRTPAVRTNSWGMRDDEPRLAKDAYRVLVMGDSVTFGPDQEKFDLYTEVAERALGQEGKVEVLNAGVCGYNTQQEFIALKEKYLPLHPDMVIFAYCTNDSDRSMIQYVPDGPIRKELMQPGIVSGEGAWSGISDKQYLALVIPRQFPMPYLWNKWLLGHSSIYRGLSLLSFKYRKGIEKMEELPNFLFSFDMSTLCAQIRRFADEHALNVRFLILPSLAQWDREAVLRCLRENAISFWDIDQEVRDRKEMHPDIFMNAPHSHLSRAGHALVGSLLAKHLREDDRQ